MHFPSPVAATWVADLINASLLGKTDAFATGINEIHKVLVGDLCFVDHPKYYDKCLQSDATFIIINNKDVAIPAGKTLLVVDEPFEAYLKIVQHFKPFELQTTSVSTSAIIGEGTVVMPNAFIGNYVKIGKNCFIHANVSILDYCELGDNVIVQSGTVIGSDAFYYNTKKNRELWYKKMISCGKVIIEDDVEIGSNTTIDRATMGSTIIRAGAKLDNLLQIAHNVEIGNNSVIAAQAGISGSAKIGNNVMIGGQAGIAGHITIADGSKINGQSGVSKSIKQPNTAVTGTPAFDFTASLRSQAIGRSLPDLEKRVKELENLVKQLLSEKVND